MTKKNTFRLLLAGLLLCACVPVQAKPVDAATARRVAENQLGTSALVDRSAELGFAELYLFAPADSHGFVVVSADDCAVPVVGWSPRNIFRADVAPLHSWLASCAAQIDDMRRLGIEGSAAVAASWREHLEGTPSPKAVAIGPLVTTIWNQAPIYQQRTPYDATAQTRCLAGCGAVAMAQVMKYWNHPATGRSSHTYTTSTNGYGPLTADFDTAYAWTLMPDELTNVSSQAEVNAVNQLLYHVGVALEMDYTPSWSNSYVYYTAYHGASVETALPTYFKYSASIRAVIMSEYTRDEWNELMMDELRALRPVVYRAADPQAGGHIFVLDGCDSRGRFHINWGWGSYGDGYFFVGSMNPDEYSAYNLGNSAVIGIKPLAAEAGEDVTIAAVSNNPAWGSVRGNIGTFPSYMGTATLLAAATDGYRFDHWSDGSINNPRYYPMCESRTDTAFFVPVGPDTVGFCRDGYRFGYGYSTATPQYGAVKLPAAAIPAGRRLSAVQVYADNVDTYTVSIHRDGTNKPGEELYSKSYDVTRGGSWQTLQLDSLLACPAGEPLWLVVRTDNSPWAVAVSRYGGNQGSFWFSVDGNIWYDNHTYGGFVSAMIRGLFVAPPTAIAPVADATDLMVHVEGLTLDATADADMALYDLAGRLLCTARGSLRYNAPTAGVYLLAVGESTHKIILR